MRAFLCIAALLLPLTGCGSKHKETPQPKTSRDGSIDARQAGRTTPPPTGNKPMTTGFAKAHSSFRDYAAKKLAISADALEVQPAEDSGVYPAQMRTGDLLQFEARPSGTDGVWTRAWVAPDGTVVTEQQNLGRMFKEAAVWTGAPAFTAMDLAKKIAWVMGMNNRVLFDPAPPNLEIGADGTGKMTFTIGYRQPGPGGAGGGPEKIGSCIATLAADHTAVLQISWRN